MKDYIDIWYLKDSIQTVVEANGYRVWDLTKSGESLILELTSHISDEEASNLCSQFPVIADYDGEGPEGTKFVLEI